MADKAADPVVVTPPIYKTVADIIVTLDSIAAWMYPNCVAATGKWQAMAKIEELKTYLKSG